MQPGMMSVDVGWCTIIRGCGCVVRNVCVHSCLLCGGWGWGVWATGGRRVCVHACMYVCIDQRHSNIYLFFSLFFSSSGSGPKTGGRVFDMGLTLH